MPSDGQPLHVLDRAIALRSLGPGEDARARSRFAVTLDRSLWVADSGPWGGYLAALLTKAIDETAPEHSLISLTLHPLRRLREGDAEVVVDVESSGSRVGHMSARIVQDGRAGVVALATLGHNPQDDFVSDYARPDAPSATDVRRRDESSHPYMQHFDVRPTTIVRPWSGDNEGTLAGWIGLVEPRPLDLPLLAALPDAWMPGTWARLTKPHGKITVELALHFRGDIAPDDTGWWFIRVRTRHVERGFADEECEVWGGDGRFLAQSRQLVLLARRD
jgi:acyl-Coa thioesterase superfamily protein/acyl-CoA thioesterase superfamily protein